MILTTDLLIDRYGSYTVQIIERAFPFRYVHLQSNGEVKVAAFSDYSVVDHFMIDDAKIAAEQVTSIGKYLRSKFKSIAKSCLEEGTVKVGKALQEQLKLKNDTAKYRFFDLKISAEGNEHIFCNVMEIYHDEFYPPDHCPSDGVNVLEKSNIYSYLRKNNIELQIC